MINHQFSTDISPWMQVTKEYETEGYEYTVKIETVDLKLQESCSHYGRAGFYKRYCRATKVHKATGKILGTGIGSHSAHGGRNTERRAEDRALCQLFKIKDEMCPKQCIPFMAKSKDIMVEYVKTPIISCEPHIKHIATNER